MPSADLRLFFRASDNQRQSFYVALESDFATFAGNISAVSSSIGLISKYEFELPVELHFASQIMAKTALTTLKSQSMVSIPQTRLAYVTMQGRPSDLQFALLTNIVKAAPLEPVEIHGSPSSPFSPTTTTTANNNNLNSSSPTRRWGGGGVSFVSDRELLSRDAFTHSPVADFSSSVEQLQKAFPAQHTSGYTRLSDIKIPEGDDPFHHHIGGTSRGDGGLGLGNTPTTTALATQMQLDQQRAELEGRERKVNAKWREMTLKESMMTGNNNSTASSGGGGGGSGDGEGHNRSNDQLLTLREQELFDQERQNGRKREENELLEKRMQKLLTEVSLRELAVAEKETSVTQREHHVINRETVLLTERQPSSSLSHSPQRAATAADSSGNGEDFTRATEEYITKLEADLKEVHMENARLKGGVVDASVQLRMERVIERENLLKQSERRMHANEVEAKQQSRNKEVNSRLYRLDQVENDLAHNTSSGNRDRQHQHLPMQQRSPDRASSPPQASPYPPVAMSSSAGGYMGTPPRGSGRSNQSFPFNSNPLVYNFNSTPHQGGGGLYHQDPTSGRDGSPNNRLRPGGSPHHSGGAGNGSSYNRTEEEVTAMMRRVREKEIVLKNVSEQQRLRASHKGRSSGGGGGNARFSFY